MAEPDTAAADGQGGQEKERPVWRAGPFPTAERWVQMAVLVWRRKHPDGTGAEREVYEVELTRTYYPAGVREHAQVSHNVLASEVALAIMMLQTASKWIDDQKDTPPA